MTTSKDQVNLIVGGGETVVVGTGAGNVRLFAKAGETRPIVDPIEKAPDVFGSDGRKLSPDTDWQRDWIALFNNSMIKPEYR